MFGRGCECVTELIVSIILGIAIGILYFLGLITGITTLLWFIFGIAAIILILLTVIASLGDRRISRCICRYGDCLLFGATLALVLSIIALVITLTITIASAILVGFIGFAIIFALIVAVELISCIVNANCRCREE